MLTMDEQKNQNADVHNCSIDGVMNDQNTNLDCNLRSPTATGAVVNGHSAVHQRSA